MIVQHLEGGEPGEFYGELTPREIHLLYLQGFRLGAEAYAGQVLDMYQANGRVASGAVAAMSTCALEFTQQYISLVQDGAVVGPSVVEGRVVSGSMMLWLSS